jgi:hypothetical protein
MSLHSRPLIAASTTLAAVLAFAAPLSAQRGYPADRDSRRTAQDERRNDDREAQARRGYDRDRSRSDRGYRNGRQRVFNQPYYSFRPRFSIGFGLSIGQQVPYPFRYYDPSGYYNHGVRIVPGYGPDRYNSGYYSRVGGLSFDLDPYDADVFIDGQYVGVAEDFSYYNMPLTLPVGRHRVDVRARGFRPASFQITIVGGQVIPYGGRLTFLR